MVIGICVWVWVCFVIFCCCFFIGLLLLGVYLVWYLFDLMGVVWWVLVFFIFVVGRLKVLSNVRLMRFMFMFGLMEVWLLCLIVSYVIVVGWSYGWFMFCFFGVDWLFCVICLLYWNFVIVRLFCGGWCGIEGRVVVLLSFVECFFGMM